LPRGRCVIEEVLGRLMYLKVIRELASSPEPLTRYRIVERTGLKFSDVSRVLARLVEMGWVIEHSTRPKKFSLNYSVREVAKLVECLRELGYIPSRSEGSG